MEFARFDTNPLENFILFSCKVSYNLSLYNQKSGTWKTTNPFREIVRDSDSQRR